MNVAFQVTLGVKNPPTNAVDIRDTGSILVLGRSPGEGRDNPFQYFCLENPMDWIHRVLKTQTQLKQLSTQEGGLMWRFFESISDLYTNVPMCMHLLSQIYSIPCLGQHFWGIWMQFFPLSILQDRDSLRMFQFSLPGCHSCLSRYLKNCQNQGTESGKGRQGKQKAVQKYGQCCSSWPLCQFHAFTPLNECSKCFILRASDSGALIVMASGISGHSWPLGHPCVHGSFLKIREIKYRLFSALMGESHCENNCRISVGIFFPSSFCFSFFQTHPKPLHLWGI